MALSLATQGKEPLQKRSFSILIWAMDLCRSASLAIIYSKITMTAKRTLFFRSGTGKMQKQRTAMP
ncbi:hypothetical protein D9I71_24355 [Escherichia coli]|nr:hypothetical protein [Escherichia coli]EAC1500468.1 hypothetical protein [Escherichia coli]EEW2457886.1 hypothetical protein [Escherichia coli]EEW2639211.1 hypothetical protein [Escherichia coli]EEY3908555.1 hypothetical protein [Escherichia coli]